MCFLIVLLLLDNQSVLDPFQLLSQLQAIRLNFHDQLAQVPDDAIFAICVEILLFKLSEHSLQFVFFLRQKLFHLLIILLFTVLDAFQDSLIHADHSAV